jgi:hypothetical protein
MAVAIRKKSRILFVTEVDFSKSGFLALRREPCGVRSDSRHEVASQRLQSVESSVILTQSLKGFLRFLPLSLIAPQRSNNPQESWHTRRRRRSRRTRWRGLQKVEEARFKCTVTSIALVRSVGRKRHGALECAVGENRQGANDLTDAREHCEKTRKIYDAIHPNLRYS